MSNPVPQLVQKLWNYCNILRDDGLSYGDYVGQLTFLLFLKIADERSHPPFNKPSAAPKRTSWFPDVSRLFRNAAGLSINQLRSKCLKLDACVDNADALRQREHASRYFQMQQDTEAPV